MSGDIQYSIRHTSQFTYSEPISESMMEVRMAARAATTVSGACDSSSRTQPRARVLAYQDALGNVVHHFDIPTAILGLWDYG